MTAMSCCIENSTAVVRAESGVEGAPVAFAVRHDGGYGFGVLSGRRHFLRGDGRCLFDCDLGESEGDVALCFRRAVQAADDVAVDPDKLVELNSFSKVVSSRGSCSDGDRSFGDFMISP